MAIGPRQAKFIQEYVKLRNGTQAAINAGYKKSSARTQAAQLLAKRNIRERVKDEFNAIAERALISVARTLREIGFVAHSDIGDFLDFSGATPKLRRAMDIPEKARRAISSIKVKRYMEGVGEQAREVEVVEFKLWDKVAALDKLCRHFAIYADQEEFEKLRNTLDEIKARQKREEPTNGKLDPS